jgi:hypothetical protein
VCVCVCVCVCEQAFTIYNFLKLLIVLLGGEKAVIEMLEKRAQMPLIFPLHWLGTHSQKSFI